MNNSSSNNNNFQYNCTCNNCTYEENVEPLHELFGYLGALGVSLLLIPQVIKTYKEKNASSLSPGFLVLNIWTALFFLIYGILESILPMLAGNCIAIVCSSLLLIMRCKQKPVVHHTVSQVENS